MHVVKFCEVGRVLGTRAAGKKIREKIISMFDNDKIVLDFSEVDIISNSFADECIGKMIAEYGIEFVKSKTTFKNVNNETVIVIKKVISDRLKDIA